MNDDSGKLGKILANIPVEFVQMFSTVHLSFFPQNVVEILPRFPEIEIV